MAKVRKPNLIDPAALVQRRVHHPIPAAGRYFAAPRLPDSFQTLIDPAKHPAQPWRDLPPPTGASPFRLSLETVLSPQAIDTISKSGRMVFHAVGDTGGVMVLVDGKYKYNLKTTDYMTGTAGDSLYFDSRVTVSYTSTPGSVAGVGDVRLESR